MKFPLFMTLLFSLMGFSAVASELHIDQGKKNLVKFISKAPMESFDGKTDQIDGYVYWEGADLLNNSEIYFEVDLSSLDTGIRLRNRHMRENYLETGKYRYATFKGHLAKVVPISESEFSVVADGFLSVHGVKHPLLVPGKVSSDGIHYHVLCDFSIALSDFHIKIPRLMFLKIDENIKIKLDFHLQTVNEKQ